MLLRPTTPESLDRLVNYLEKHRGLEWSIVNGTNESYRDLWIRTAKEAIQANDGVNGKRTESNMESRLIMKSRQITLTIKKAKEWYNSGNADLREIALQAFTEKELTTENFKSVKTFYEACQTLGISISATDAVISTMENQIPNYTKASIAMYKLNIIRQALNKGHEMKFTEGTIYYPYIPFVTKESPCYNDRLRNGDVVEVAQFRVHGKEYTLLGGLVHYGSISGLGFYSILSVGDAFAGVGFLGCATKKIAKHMSRYFAKEIFDAMYGDFVDYEWAGTNKID